MREYNVVECGQLVQFWNTCCKIPANATFTPFEANLAPNWTITPAATNKANKQTNNQVSIEQKKSHPKWNRIRAEKIARNWTRTKWQSLQWWVVARLLATNNSTANWPNWQPLSRCMVVAIPDNCEMANLKMSKPRFNLKGCKNECHNSKQTGLKNHFGHDRKCFKHE